MARDGDLDMILRRIQVERKKGTPIDEMYRVIHDLIESQRLVEYYEGLGKADPKKPGE